MKATRADMTNGHIFWSLAAKTGPSPTLYLFMVSLVYHFDAVSMAILLFLH
jgi:hypothetical protein